MHDATGKDRCYMVIVTCAKILILVIPNQNDNTGLKKHSSILSYL